jgi:hypothetical protein
MSGVGGTTDGAAKGLESHAASVSTGKKEAGKQARGGVSDRSSVGSMPVPDGVDSLLWRLSSLHERLQLLHQSGSSQTTAAQGAEGGSGLSPDRQQQIDAWLKDNVNAETSALFMTLDSDGGEQVSAALNGNSTLKTLTPQEQRYLLDAAVKAWQSTGNIENIQEAAQNIDSAQTRRIIAEAYAAPVAENQQYFAKGGKIYTTKESEATKSEMLKVAIGLDPAAVINTFDGVEGSLGKVVSDMQGWEGRQLRTALLQTVASGKVDPTDNGISQMVTAVFLKSAQTDFLSSTYRRNMSDALAQIMVQREGVSAHQLDSKITELSNRYQSILKSQGGRDLLLNDKVAPALRGWAIAEIANNPALTAETLKGGWESGAVSKAYAKPIIQRYQARGTEPQVLSGEALRNTIGQALGIKPDKLPPANETASDKQSRLEAGLNHGYYGPNKRIDAIVKKLEQVAGVGEGGQVNLSIMPVTVTSNEFGAAAFNVFKVTDAQGKEVFVEGVDPRREYQGFEDWQSNGRLPPGKMTYVSGMSWGTSGGSSELVTESTPMVTDTFGEWAREVGDGVALAAGIIAGGVIIFGTAGLGTFLVAGAAGLYATARAGEGLYDAHTHGVDISNLSDSEVRSYWLDAAAGTLSFGAMGVARFAKFLPQGARVTSWAASGAASLELAANTADLAAATNQAYELSTKWDKLDNGQRAMGLLSLAFWGGMTAASTKAGGGSLADGYSFTRLRNNIEFGSPYPVAQNPELQPGQMRATYDVAPNGRATNIRIEHGGAAADPAMLALHTRAARQMEASGGLLDWISTRLNGNSQPAVGSAAWEAQLELSKIQAEAQSISQALATPGLSSAQRAGLDTRLSELDTAINYQSERLTQLGQRGEGWVASPSAGDAQAKGLGWPEAPPGYSWVAGVNEPHLRRLDPQSSAKLYYDAEAGSFTQTRPAKSGAQGVDYGPSVQVRPGWNEPFELPKNWNGPVNHGEWVGPKGNSSWIDDRPEVIRIVGVDQATGKANPIVFYKGRVEFSAYAQGTLEVKGLVGTKVDSNADMKKIMTAIAVENNLFKPNGEPNLAAARRWLANADDGFGGKGLAPHHAGHDLIELIPSDLHKVQHTDITR